MNAAGDAPASTAADAGGARGARDARGAVAPDGAWRGAYRFFHSLRVRWAEVDRQDIVFNGHYLAYFDVAITEYWRAIGVPYPAVTQRWGSDLFVVKAGIEYHAPAHYDDVLDIGVRVARVGNSSIVFDVGIYRGDDHLIGGEVVYVNADPKTRKPSRVPDELRALIAAMESAAA